MKLLSGAAVAFAAALVAGAPALAQTQSGKSPLTWVKSRLSKPKPAPAPAAPTPPARPAPVRAFTPVTDNIYRASNGNWFSLVAVTPGGIVVVDPLNVDFSKSLKGQLDAHTFALLETVMDEVFESNCFKIVFRLDQLEYVASAGMGVFIATLARKEQASA